jgi:two-component system response regulator HydG
MRDAAERILKRAHYRVVQAASAGEARVAWIAHHPEVALVDLELGGEPGSALLDETWVRDLDTAIVVLTGSDDVDVANESFENGASGYVVKPFTPNELLMQVSSALRRRDLERRPCAGARAQGHREHDGNQRLETALGDSNVGIFARRRATRTTSLLRRLSSRR